MKRMINSDDIVSLNDVISEVSGLEIENGNKANVIKATNNLYGGAFTATTGWGGTNAILSVLNNTLVATSNGANTEINAYQTVANLFSPLVVGHQYYYRVGLKSSVNATKFKVEFGGMQTDVQTSGVVASTQYSFSGVITCSSLLAFICGLFAADLTGATLTISRPIIIDLTATFGAGKEPTLAQMNADLAYYTNSWFDGTVPFINLYTLNATKANRQQEDWITPTLLNSWVAFDTARTPMYMKDGMGFVHIKGCIKSGTVGANAFTLPTAYRPGSTHAFAVKSDSLFGYVDVASDGTVVVNGSNSSLYLDGITYMAGY